MAVMQKFYAFQLKMCLAPWTRVFISKPNNFSKSEGKQVPWPRNGGNDALVIPHIF
jgi:hypothetical protein